LLSRADKDGHHKKVSILYDLGNDKFNVKDIELSDKLILLGNINYNSYDYDDLDIKI